jgi:hypothetical protein
LNKLHTFVAPLAARWATVADVRTKALASIPGGTAPAVCAVFNAGISAAGEQSEVVITHMKYFGSVACETRLSVGGKSRRQLRSVLCRVAEREAAHSLQRWRVKVR